jgi:uncharacterized protein YabN with tetrapyrrole methylase and pyrophosphatase domain
LRAQETYEVIEAIDAHDHGALCEELGDFVFEAVFLAQLESEAGYFTIADSLKSIADKLVRRHPHVFAKAAGDAPLDSPGQVRTRWEEIKAREHDESPTPKTLLSDRQRFRRCSAHRHARGVRRFRWSTTRDVVARFRRRSTSCARWSTRPDGRRGAPEEMGDLLFSIASSRRLGIGPDRAAEGGRQVQRRFGKLEQTVIESGR